MRNRNSINILDSIEVKNPCPLPPGARNVNPRALRNYCNHCGKHVHNIARLTRFEAWVLMQRRTGPLCVSLRKSKEGDVRFREIAVIDRLTPAGRKLLVAFLSSAVFKAGPLAGTAYASDSLSAMCPSESTLRFLAPIVAAIGFSAGWIIYAGISLYRRKHIRAAVLFILFLLAATVGWIHRATVLDAVYPYDQDGIDGGM